MGWLNDWEYYEKFTRIRDAGMTQIEIKLVGRHANSVLEHEAPRYRIQDTKALRKLSSTYRDVDFFSPKLMAWVRTAQRLPVVCQAGPDVKAVLKPWGVALTPRKNYFW